MGQSFTLAGAHLKCYINGKLLGYVISVPSFQVRHEWAPLREIDSLLARQLAPRMYEVSGNIQVLRGRSTGGLEGAGLVSSGESMMLQKYLTIELQDRFTQDIVFRAVSCEANNQQWQIQTRGLVVGSFNFTGITFATEATQ